MEKRMNKMVKNLVLIAACAIMCVPVFAADDGYALLVQQSPPGGGSVNLGSGVHKMGIGQTVSLSATPKSGYRFLYWLGDVSAADAAETSIQIDSPKMVVAVFARDEFDDEISGGAGGGTTAVSSGGGFGGGGQRFSYNPVQSAASVSAPYDYGYSGVTGTDGTLPPQEEDPNLTDYIPVPEGDEEVPEPATLALLGIGSTALLVRRKRR